MPERAGERSSKWPTRCGDLPQERLHLAFNTLGLELDSRSHATTWNASGEETEQVAFPLDIANAVWGQAGYSFLPEYLNLLALNCGAEVRLVDFQADAPGAVEAINQWVSQETEGRRVCYERRLAGGQLKGTVAHAQPPTL